LVSYLGLYSTPRYHNGSRQVVTALSVLLSPPRSGVFIAIVVDFRRTPFSSLSESFSNAAEADQDSLVASLLGNELTN